MQAGLLSREITQSGVPTLSTKAEGNTASGVMREPLADPARSENHGMYGTSMRENRESPVPARPRWSPGGPLRERRGGNPGMNGHGKSDRLVVPANPPNKAAAAEAAEERGAAKGNTDGETRPGRSAGPGVSSELDRVRQVAGRDKEARFTALLHHVSLERLVLAYWALSPKAAPGVDGVTWEDYGQDLAANLRDLHDRVHSGRYRARPSRRAYIPKADGRLRPLGIATDAA